MNLAGTESIDANLRRGRSHPHSNSIEPRAQNRRPRKRVPDFVEDLEAGWFDLAFFFLFFSFFSTGLRMHDGVCDDAHCGGNVMIEWHERDGRGIEVKDRQTPIRTE